MLYSSFLSQYLKFFSKFGGSQTQEQLVIYPSIKYFPSTNIFQDNTLDYIPSRPFHSLTFRSLTLLPKKFYQTIKSLFVQHDMQACPFIFLDCKITIKKFFLACTLEMSLTYTLKIVYFLLLPINLDCIVNLNSLSNHLKSYGFPSIFRKALGTLPALSPAIPHPTLTDDFWGPENCFPSGPEP